MPIPCTSSVVATEDNIQIPAEEAMNGTGHHLSSLGDLLLNEQQSERHVLDDADDHL